MTANGAKYPWFKERVEGLLADPAIRDMELDELGFVALARWHYWRAGCTGFPADPRGIAREIGLDPRRLVPRLMGALMTQFSRDPANDERLICRDLDEQFETLIASRRRQSEGGREGRARQLTRVNPAPESGVNPASEIRGQPRAEVEVEVETEKEEARPNGEPRGSDERNPDREGEEAMSEERKQIDQPRQQDAEPELTAWHKREATRLGIERQPDEPAWAYAGRIARAHTQRGASGSA